MSFKKEKPVENLNIGCGTCSPVTQFLNMNRLLAVGFGECNATKNGVQFYSEQDIINEHYPTAQTIEDLAKKDPDSDWRISFNAPLYDQVYQRQGVGHWVCIESGMGFA